MDGTSGADKLDEGVGPGQTYTYEWLVMGTSSPTPDDPDCLTWVYHSHVDTPKDTNTGLIGVLLTCRPGNEVFVVVVLVRNLVEFTSDSVFIGLLLIFS